jgi:DNA-directed RNA polymerase specialized sigma24 family protein
MFKLDFPRIVLHRILSWLKQGDAKRNLQTVLESRIRSSLLVADEPWTGNEKPLSYARLLDGMADEAEVRVGRKLDREVFKENIVDMFIDEEAVDQLVTKLQETFRKAGLSLGEASTVVQRGVVTPELKEKFRVISQKKKPAEMIYAWLENFFRNRTERWIERKQKEVPLEESGELPGEPAPETGAEPDVPSEKEIEEETKRTYRWEEGLLEAIHNFIDSRVQSGDKRMIYKKILSDRLLGSMNIEELAKETGVSVGSVHSYEKNLKELLSEYLASRRDVRTFLGPAFVQNLRKKKVEIPDYEDFMKENPGERKSLREFIHDRFGGRGKPVSELTEKALDLFIEGLGISEAADRLKADYNAVKLIKARYFNDAYEDWYRERVEDIRKSFTAAVKRVKYREPGKPVEEEAVEVRTVHENLVNKALQQVDDPSKRSGVKVYITFTSDFDHYNRKKDDVEPHFRWLSYAASVEAEKTVQSKKYGQVTYTLDYHWTAEFPEKDMTDAGLEEALKKGTSSLKIDGKEFTGGLKTPTSEPDLKERLDSHMKEHVLSEGLMPHANLPVEFYNTKMKKRYLGIDEFKRAYDVMKTGEPKPGERLVRHDAPHRKRLEEKTRLEEQKKMGPPGHTAPEHDPTLYSERVRLMKLIDVAREELKKEKDAERKDEQKKHLQELELKLRNIQTEDWKDIEDMIGEEMKFWEEQDLAVRQQEELKKLKTEKPAVPVHQASVFIYAATVAAPSSAESRELVDILKQYGVKEPDPSGWLMPSGILALAKALRMRVQEELDRRIRTHKPFGEDPGDWEKKQEKAKEKYTGDLERALKLFPELVKDLKERRDRFRKEHPADFEAAGRAPDVKKAPEEKAKPMADPELKLKPYFVPKKTGEEKTDIRQETKPLRTDYLWVDDPKRIEDLILKVKDSLKEPLAVGKAPPVFPDSSKAESNELMALFRKYEMTGGKPNPEGWLEYGDSASLADSLRDRVHKRMEKELEDRKPAQGAGKKEIKEEKKRIEDLYMKDLEKAEKLFPAFIEDLKARREKFEKDHPDVYKSMESRKDMHWIDNKVRVEKELAGVAEALKKPVRIKKETQPVVRMLEKTKYDSLRAFLLNLKNGIARIAEFITASGLTPAGREDVIGPLKVRSGELKKEHSRFAELVSGLVKKQEGGSELTPEEQDKLSKLSRKLGELSGSFTAIDKDIMALGEIPDMNASRALVRYLNYFSSLYSFLVSIEWFREGAPWERRSAFDEMMTEIEEIWAVRSGAGPEAVPEEAVPEKTEWEKSRDKLFDRWLGKGVKPTKPALEEVLERKRKRLVDTAREISALPMKAHGQVRSGIGDLKKQIGEFTLGLSELEDMYRRMKEASGISHGSVLRVVTAFSDMNFLIRHGAAETEEEKKELERRRREMELKYIIPEDLMHRANNVVIRLQHHPNRIIRTIQTPVAAEELKKITDNLLAAYREYKDNPEAVDALAKKIDTTSENVEKGLESRLKAMTEASLDVFIRDWMNVVNKTPPKEEKSPLGNKPPQHYERIVDFIAKHVMRKEQLYTPGDIVKYERKPEETPGVPTPKEIREEIERTWSKERTETHDELVQKYKNEFLEAPEHGEGSGKSKRKMRHKVIKPAPPVGTWEVLKDQVVKLLRHEAPRRVVTTVMAIYAHRLKDAFKNRKEDEEISLEGAIDGFVTILKELQKTIVNLKVAPSTTAMKYPPPGAPKFTGAPDIPVDNYKECVELFEKIKAVYDTINYYIAPDVVGMPPERLRDLPRKETAKKYLPDHLAEWSEVFMKSEGKAPVAPPEKHEPLPHILSPEVEKMKEKAEPGYTGRGAFDFHSQMSFNVAGRAKNLDISDDEFEAILS